MSMATRPSTLPNARSTWRWLRFCEKVQRRPAPRALPYAPPPRRSRRRAREGAQPTSTKRAVTPASKTAHSTPPTPTTRRHSRSLRRTKEPAWTRRAARFSPTAQARSLARRAGRRRRRTRMRLLRCARSGSRATRGWARRWRVWASFQERSKRTVWQRIWRARARSPQRRSSVHAPRFVRSVSSHSSNARVLQTARSVARKSPRPPSPPNRKGPRRSSRTEGASPRGMARPSGAT
mmetsp:Transcript_43652/g.108015  ORF Transcript_43652/g.108015 Transcript_43652/m.108015 type:complete len:236 (+) Transcript_43652:350-1057(+)